MRKQIWHWFWYPIRSGIQQHSLIMIIHYRYANTYQEERSRPNPVVDINVHSRPSFHSLFRCIILIHCCFFVIIHLSLTSTWTQSSKSPFTVNHFHQIRPHVSRGVLLHVNPPSTPGKRRETDALFSLLLGAPLALCSHPGPSGGQGQGMTQPKSWRILAKMWGTISWLPG